MGRILGLLKVMFYKFRYGRSFTAKKMFSVRLHWTSSIIVDAASKVILEGDVSVRSGVVFRVSGGGVLTIGREAFFNTGCRVNCREKIDIGDRALFGENVLIYDHNHSIKKKARSSTFSCAPVSIDDDVWIGSMSVITKGVSVGAGSVVGAGNCLRKPVASDTLYVDDSRILDIVND